MSIENRARRRRRTRCSRFRRPPLENLEVRIAPAVFAVTPLAVDGARGSLRNAINQADSKDRNLINEGPVLAVVMKTVLTGGQPTIYLQAQSYPGVTKWGSQFTSTTWSDRPPWRESRLSNGSRPTVPEA